MKIIFVCTGNTCRSPMAEGYLKSLNINGLEVASRGLQAGGAVSENSVAAMREAGIDISSHIPRNLTREEIENADIIVCMTATHKAILESAGVKADIRVLGSGISDPFGGDIDSYIAARNDIMSEIDRMLAGYMRGFFPRDSKEIAEIEAQCFSAPWSEQAITDSVKNGTEFFIFEKNFSVAGYVSLNTVLDEGYINNIAALESFRRQGIGARLLKRVDAFAKEKSLSFVTLEVRESNTAAIALYAAAGYEKAGVRKGFYEAPRENALIMTKYYKTEE